tara:strand:- start:724 stop:825 length:102 start_codon:yes stop_codon:yes gene_type:complete
MDGITGLIVLVVERESLLGFEVFLNLELSMKAL